MIRIVLLLLLMTASMTTPVAAPVAAVAEGDEQLWQAIEQLKMRIDRLEAKTGIAAEPKMPAAAEKPGSTASGKVYTRYWLSKNAAFDGKSEKPLREGLMLLDSVIKLEPERYGYKKTGIFDDHNDPSLFPVAAVLIEGELDIREGGLYQLVVKPTPPREVGGAGNVEVSVEVTIGGDRLFTLPFSKKLSSRQKQVSIKAGRQSLRIKILARSPGFGPSPSHTEVYIGLQARGEITSSPVKSYLATD